MDEEASGVSLGSVLGLLLSVPVGPWSGRREVPRGSGEALEASWGSLGALKEAWSAKGVLPGAYGALLEASGGALGALLELSWAMSEAS